LFLFFKSKSRIDPLALVTSATVIDLETLYYLLLGDPFNHRIWHSYFFALVVFPILITLAIYLVEHRFEKKLSSAYRVLKLKPPKTRYSLSIIYISCLIGGFSHIFFDMFTHESMPYVLYPLFYGNPFYLGEARFIVEGVVAALALYSVYCWWKTSKLD
jgi:membrane-bound metal-dependent hydrolase YbcI (DUF457 family)